MSRSRRTAASVLLLTLLVLLSACTGAPPPSPDGDTSGPAAAGPTLPAAIMKVCQQVFTRDNSASTQRLIIVDDPTASVAPERMPGGLRSALTNLSKINGALTVIGVDGTGAAPRILAENIAVSTPGPRDRPSVGTLAALVPDCVQQVFLGRARPTAPGTDLFRAMSAASELITKHTTIWTLSDMLATSGSLQLSQSLLAEPPARAAIDAAGRAPLNLAGSTWRVAGIANSTAPLTPADRHWLLTFTVGLCHAWNASGCRQDDLEPANVPTVDRSLPRDPIPAFPRVITTSVVHGCSFEVPGVLAFAGDSAGLSRDVDGALAQPLAALTGSASSTAVVVGHTASTSLHPTPIEEQRGVTLSRIRARAVVGWLYEHGVSLARLTARGVGDTQPEHQDIDPRTGAQNRFAAGERRVDITVRGRRADRTDPFAQPFDHRGLRTLGPLRRRRPRWWLALLPLALLPLLWLPHAGASAPTGLDNARLVGARSPAPISAVVWLDESGSFTQYDSIRANVLRELATWAPRNLRLDDRVTVISFADAAGFRLHTVSVADLAAHGAALTSPGNIGGGTDVLPALELTGRLHTGLPTTVIAVTDTQIGPVDTAKVRSIVRSTHATTMTTIVPSGIDVTPVWRRAFPWSAVVSAEPGDADATGLALAEALAHATGQRVEHA